MDDGENKLKLIIKTMKKTTCLHSHLIKICKKIKTEYQIYKADNNNCNSKFDPIALHTQYNKTYDLLITQLNKLKLYKIIDTKILKEKYTKQIKKYIALNEFGIPDASQFIFNATKHEDHQIYYTQVMAYYGEIDDILIGMNKQIDFFLEDNTLSSQEKLELITINETSIQKTNDDTIPEPWTDLQNRILEELSPEHRDIGKMTAEMLAKKLGCTTQGLHKAMKPLKDANKVKNKSGLGYYRPESPPKPITDTQ